MKRCLILSVAFAWCAAVYAWTKPPLAQHDKIEFALARGCAEAPSAVFPLTVPGEPVGCWWDDKALHVGETVVDFASRHVMPTNGAVVKFELEVGSIGGSGVSPLRKKDGSFHQKRRDAASPKTDPRSVGTSILRLEAVLDERASAYRVPDFGILGNRKIDTDVTLTAKTDGKVRVYMNAVGPRSPRFIREKKLPVRAGETVRVNLNGTATDTGKLMFDIYETDGRPLFMAFWPFHDPTTKFAFVAVFTDRTNEVMRLHVDQWVEKGESCTLTMRAEDLLTGKDTGFSTSATLAEKTGRAIVELDVKGLPPGMFKMNYDVRTADGKAVYSDYLYYAKPDRGRCLWDGTAFGDEDTVPPPWTKPAWGKDGFKVWNRDVRLGGNGLVSSIVSAGRELLAQPVTVEHRGSGVSPLQNKDGSSISKRRDAASPNAVSPNAASPNDQGLRSLAFSTRLVRTGVSFADYRLTAKNAPVTADVRVEFDGYMFFRLNYRTPVEDLRLTVPVRRDRVVGFDDCSSPIEKLALPPGKTADVAYDPGAKPWWWMGSATEGLMGGNSSLRGWHCKDLKRGYRLQADGEACTFTMAFVDVPCGGTGARTVEFYLQPTPVKPKDQAFALLPRGKFVLGSASMAKFCEVKYPGLVDLDKVEWAKQFRRRGERYFYYCGTRLTSPVQPWWGWFADDWYEHPDPCFFAEEVNFKDRAARDRGVWVTGCLNSKSFFEHKLWTICSFLTDPNHGVEDLYLDLAGPGTCHNRNHGCTWADDFGRTQHDRSLYRFREIHKRIYRELKKKTPTANMMGHLQFQRTPSDVFFDRLLMGETYDRFVHGTMSYYDVLNPEMMQIQYASRSAEIVVDMLPQIDRVMSMYAPEKLKTYDPHAPENDRVNRHATAYFKIHDLEVVPQPRGAEQWSDPDRVLRAFGADRRHFAYYKPDAPVSVSKPDPRFLWALYEGNERRMLILLNDTDRTVTETVTVKGVSGVGEDIFNHRRFDFTSGACAVTLPPRESHFILWEPDEPVRQPVPRVLLADEVVDCGAPAADAISAVWRKLGEIRTKEPAARTVVCACRSGSPTWRETVNGEIQKFADGRGVMWCDISGSTRDPQELVRPLVDAIRTGGGWPIAPVCRTHPCRIEGEDAQPASVRPVSRIMEKSWRGVNWWGERLARNRDFIRTCGKDIDFVFAGSSSVHFWESSGGREYAALTNRYTILNCGYGGDMTQTLLWRFRNGELDGYRAKGVVLSIGSNNNGVGGAKVADTVAGIRACLAEVEKRQPQAKVVLLAYQPRAVGTKDGDPSKDNGADRRNRETSAEMAKMADGKRIFYVDVYDRFLVDGKLPKTLSEDYLHPTEKGYGIIREALEPILEKIVRGK